MLIPSSVKSLDRCSLSWVRMFPHTDVLATVIPTHSSFAICKMSPSKHLTSFHQGREGSVLPLPCISKAPRSHWLQLRSARSFSTSDWKCARLSLLSEVCGVHQTLMQNLGVNSNSYVSCHLFLGTGWPIDLKFLHSIKSTYLMSNGINRR